MKRFRFLTFSLDSSRNIFKTTESDYLEKMKEEQKEAISQKYGAAHFEEKFDRWLAIPKPVISIVTEHTYLLEDIENAYVLGSYYASLTGACCLGERIFNQIILNVRDSYKSTDWYKKIYRSNSFDSWDVGVQILRDWKIIESKTENDYRELAKLRNESVHFQGKDQDLVLMTKKAITLINSIVSDLFELKRENKFLLFFEVPGEIYLKKEAEDIPFVKAFYISHASLVGFKHSVKLAEGPRFGIVDPGPYKGADVTDSEFVRLRKEYINM